jgi:uncharacterized protein (DUF983 family)
MPKPKGIDATCPGCGEDALRVRLDNLTVIFCPGCDADFGRADLLDRRAKLDALIRLLDHLATFDAATAIDMAKPAVDLSLIDDAVA